MAGDAVDHRVGGRETRQISSWPGWPSTTPVIVVRLPSIQRTARKAKRGTKRIRTDQAGVGLGLAIVKSITQAHDGTLALTPRAAGGLRVTVQLPAAPTHTGG